jgi:hypothetical protein
LSPSASDPPQIKRLAILELSGSALTKTQSQTLTAALAQACREETGFELIAESQVAAYLKKQKKFSVLLAEDAQALCKNLALDYLLISTVERILLDSTSTAEGDWRITLRWLDGSSGQVTKTLSREYAGNFNVMAPLPLGEMFRALLDSPEIIIPVGEVASEMPAALVDSSETITAQQDGMASTITLDQNGRGGRPWFWYITGAAVVSGGSAFLLLKKSSDSVPAKTFLPQPPDPPK